MTMMTARASITRRRVFRSTCSRPPYICHSCLERFPLHQRFYSSSITPTNPPPPPPPSGFAHLTTRRLISLRGPDASHFLQGIITANVPATSHRTSGFYAAFLNSTGRVLNDVFLYSDPDAPVNGWLVEVDAAEAQNLYKHLKRFKLRSKFDLRLVDESEMGVWSVWHGNEGKSRGDGGSAWTAHTMGDSSPSSSGEIGCVDARAPGMGRRLILPGGKKPADGTGLEESTEEAYRIRRYLKGVAEGQSEILRESALVQESNIDFMGGVDYRKGCYVGQELTIRTHHTGVIRKRILPVMIYGADEDEPKSLEYKPNAELDMPPAETGIGRHNKKGRSAGKILCGVGNVGLGLCRLEIMTNTTVQGEAGGYKEGDEFKLEWKVEDDTTKMVKVKAFVPPWHLTK